MPIAGQVSWEAALVAFLAGAASFLSPCVAPLIPGYITYLSGSGASPEAGKELSQQPRWYARPALRVSLLFVAGFSVAFIALGFAAAWFGVLLSAYRPVLEAITGIVMILMGAFLLNLLPSAVMNLLYRERKLHPSGRWIGGAAPFGLGIIFAAGWTPCIGPVLGSILLYAGASASLALGGFLLAMYALGFAVPFLLLGVGWGTGLQALGWTRKYGRMVSLVSGVALILVGVFFLSGQMYTFSIWAQRAMPPFFQ
ncbi:MAG TPA: cytochrome c biogenesis protein CcdA [Ktedonobacterales bacterium]|nr:cytochrome c biogenesis protein CcdA [Ktedonobacterales bacterium]